MFHTRTFSLLKQLVKRDLSLRYRSTLLGFFWSLAKPCMLVGLFYTVFSFLLGIRLENLKDFQSGTNYGVFVSIGIITWGFISAGLMQGVVAYIDHAHLISRASFWRPVLPLAGVLSQWIHYLFAQGILVIVLGWLGYHDWEWFLVLLVVLSLIELLFVASLAWLLAWFHVLARDTIQIVELVLMLWFYLSPIIYPASLPIQVLSAYHLGFLFLLNPLTPLIMIRQRVLMNNYLLDSAQISPSNLLLGCFFVVALGVMLILGYLAYRNNRKVNQWVADRI